MHSIKYSQSLLEEVSAIVRTESKNAMDACMDVCKKHGYPTSRRNELFEQYMEYCIGRM